VTLFLLRRRAAIEPGGATGLLLEGVFSMRRLTVVAVLAVLLAPAATSGARLNPSWPYKKLLKEADLVVIAEATATADTKDRFRERGVKVEYIGVETTFDVKLALKGKAPDELKVLHFRRPKGVGVANGHRAVTFHREEPVIITESIKALLGRPQYLLFLKKGKDGRYEPVSGRTDPVYSVREMHSPLPDSLFPRKGAK
jgi:hypothetical protein